MSNTVSNTAIHAAINAASSGVAAANSPIFAVYLLPLLGLFNQIIKL